MIALLGLLAVAGYKNRGRISEMLQSGAGVPNDGGAIATGQPQGGGTLSDLGGLFAGAAGGGTLAEGLNSLVEKFRGAGKAEVAESWVGTGANHTLEPGTLGEALGADTIAELQLKTGLTRDEILTRLSSAIPETVDRFTPQGRLPDASEAGQFV
jgi:uncharacterized protein YidB (DUF937 family)